MSSAEFLGPSFRGRDAAQLPALARCEGFRVESADGYVGVVEALRYAPSTKWDRPSELAVRPTDLAVHAGRSSKTLLIIPLAEIEEVFVTERRVVLRPSPRIAATERMAPPDAPDGRRRDVDPDHGGGP